jgi:putative YhbY family RNA-binding protein
MNTDTNGVSDVLLGKDRRALRARAHGLKPVVWIAGSGITPGAMSEIERALTAHELIKIHAAGGNREARAALLTSICTELQAQPVQVIGKMLVAFRARPDPVPEPAPRIKTASKRPRRRSAQVVKRT